MYCKTVITLVMKLTAGGGDMMEAIYDYWYVTEKQFNCLPRAIVGA